MLSILSQADMKELEFTLVGSDSYAARFGDTITNLGDIDDDGFSGKLVEIFGNSFIEFNLKNTLTILHVIQKMSESVVQLVSFFS